MRYLLDNHFDTKGWGLENTVQKTVILIK